MNNSAFLDVFLLLMGIVPFFCAALALSRIEVLAERIDRLQRKLEEHKHK